MSSRDYYDVLGLQKGASESDIKKAYRKMALKWHPDKNADNKTQAEKKFKEIAEAYAVLSDDQKKQQYDRFGHDAFTSGPSGSSFRGSQPAGFSFEGDISPEDIFSAFFGGDPSMFSQGFNGARVYRRTYTGPNGTRHTTYQRAGSRRAQGQDSSNFSVLLNLLPVIMLLLFSSGMNWLSGDSDGSGAYSFTRAGAHTLLRKTGSNGIQYFVSPRTNHHLSRNQPDRESLEQQVEWDYYQDIKTKCSIETEEQRSMADKASAVGDVAEMKRVRAMPSPHCDSLFKYFGEDVR